MEVDDPVELHDEAGFAVLEAEVGVVEAGAGSQQVPRETTGLPGAHVALQITAVLVLCRLDWRRGAKGKNPLTIQSVKNSQHSWAGRQRTLCIFFVCSSSASQYCWCSSPFTESAILLPKQKQEDVGEMSD